MTTAELDLKGRVPLFRMKSEQFCELPHSERFRLELLAGEVLMSARPSPAHQCFAFRLGIALHHWVDARGLGLVLPATQLELDEDWMPIPDLVFVPKTQLHQVQRKKIVGPVGLAVEILSPNDEEADRAIKFAAYARSGIPWYWIVDLVQRQLEEYKLVGKTYRKPAVIAFSEPFAPRLFKGLTIDLASLELRPG